MNRTIEMCQRLATEKDGKCLSTEYKNNKTKYEWECHQGHRWSAKANDIQQGQWCSRCSYNIKHDIQWCQQLAINKNGKCLSIGYVNNSTKYEWECHQGHRWLATANSVHKGGWCLICSGNKKKNLDDIQVLAASRGGVCLSIEYKNNKTKYEWQCTKGHRWSAKSNDIQNGQWCKICAGLTKKNLQYLQSLAQSHGGVCLSTEYFNIHTKYEWQCTEGHRWEAQANTVQYDHWCPKCKHQQSKPEKIIFDLVHNKYPDALERVRGLLPNKRFELDIYIPSLKKAIEFDGDYWHANYKAVDRDTRKNQGCVDAGIGLLRILESDYKKNPDVEMATIWRFLGVI